MTATSGDPPTVLGWDSGGRGIFRSTEGGDPGTWVRIDAEGLPAGAVGAFGATTNGDAVYASTEVGVFRSVDRGESWEETGEQVVVFLAVGDDPQVVYGSAEDAVMRSTDGGATWELLGPEEAGMIVALTTTPDVRTVLAADRDNIVWRSDDAGQTWTRIDPP
jgi:photosystem II stability/assembly factor-like uncharacterized protein